MSVIEVIRLLGTEFGNAQDGTIQSWIELTQPFLSKKIFGDMYDQALALLTCHRMKMAGMGDSSYGTVGDTLRVGNYSEGETSLGFTTNQGTNLLPNGELALTSYGLQFLNIRRLRVVPIHSAGEG